MMLSFVLLLLDIEHYSIITIKKKDQSIHLPLTKSRLSLLNKPRKLTENNEGIAFFKQISIATVSYDLRTAMILFFPFIRRFKKQIICLFKRFKRVNLCYQWSLF